MLVFLNGQLVPEEQATVSVFDRGFLYGDGLFETVRIANGRPFRWTQHVERLRRGAQFLKLSIPFVPEALHEYVLELVRKNGVADGLLRLTLSRGVGPRGYSPRGAEQPTLVMSLHPAPESHPGHPPRWQLVTATCRLPAGEPLAQFKTCNKLPQILARAEADAAGANEALLLNTDGHVVEASGANLFWVIGATVFTPPLAAGILPGVTRAVVHELGSPLGLPIREANTTADELSQADGVFLSVSSVGIAEGLSLDGCPLRQSPIVCRLSAAYADLLDRETLCSPIASSSRPAPASYGEPSPSTRFNSAP